MEYFENVIHLTFIVVLEPAAVLIPAFSILNLVFIPCGLVENLEKFIDVIVKSLYKIMPNEKENLIEYSPCVAIS